MCNITLIGTRHSTNGDCNRNSLYNIINNINPEVIFEEVPPSCFDAYYIDNEKGSLEKHAINKYLERHQAVHIPVDYDNMPSNSFFKDDANMRKKIKEINYEYSCLEVEIETKVKWYGFTYLNSSEYIKHNNELENEIDKTLQMLSNENFLQIRKEWYELQEKRDNEMIKNIYNYSKMHKYNMGLFIVGAAHRKSIISKIHEYDKNEDAKLNWNYNNYNSVIAKPEFYNRIANAFKEGDIRM